jgi:hypothetical protein
MPPQYSSISSCMVMPAGASFTPGFFTRPETEKLRKPLRSRRPCDVNQSGPFFDYVADPVHGLDVLLERRTAEEADLRDIRRAMARHSALAFDLSIIADSSPQI